MPTLPQSCSLNDPDAFRNIAARRALALARPQIVVAHLPFHAAKSECLKRHGLNGLGPLDLHVSKGTANREVAVGNETGMFRHEKTFVHPTVLAIAFGDGEPVSEA